MKYTGPDADQARAIIEQYYPEHVIRQLSEAGVSLRTIGAGQRWGNLLEPEHSRKERCIGGFYRPKERRLYIRDCTPLVIVHEAAHALDFAVLTTFSDKLRSRTYSLRKPFLDAFIESAENGFLTDYAASHPVENFAESVRAYLGANEHNLPNGPDWPEVSRDRLRELSPTMYRELDPIFNPVTMKEAA